MAFNTSKSTSNRNNFVAYLASKKTGKVVSWINLTDTFARQVFGTELKNITAEEAEAVLPGLLGNDYVEVHITDTTAELVTVDATEF